MGLDAMGIGSIADLIKDGIDKIFPNPTEAAAAKIALLNAQNAGVLKSMDDQFQTNIEQIKTNAAAEATGKNTFRDGAGWVCVFGFGVTILKPLIEWGAVIVGHPITLPSVDTSTITTLLFALLGVGGMHVYERTQK